MSVEMISLWPSLVGATMVALVHVSIPRFRFMSHSSGLWLSASAGVAIAYVFVDIFPHLAKARSKLEEIIESSFYGFLAHHQYVVSLTGFCVTLGLVLSVRRYRENQDLSNVSLANAPITLLVGCLILVTYNFVIGYLLAEQSPMGPESVLLFALAMLIHVAGVDWLFRDQHQYLYDHTIRFTFATAILMGWLIGVTVPVSYPTIALLYAFMAGGIIVITMIYELAHINSWKQYGTFCVGAFAFSALIVLVEYLA